jgi:manganese transport system permease protein
MQLAEYLSQPIPQRALLACLMIGFANGFVSGYVVLRRSSLQLGTISHSLLPGIAFAVLLFGLSDLSTLIGAVIAALIVGLGAVLLTRTSRLDQDTATGILYTTAFAIGLLILKSQSLDEWLFGSIASMADADLWMAYVISLIAVISLTAMQRPLLIFLFEPNVAASLGVPVRVLNYVLFGIVILVLVTSLQAVGCILSIGLLTTPAATIYLLTDDAKALFWGGGLLGAAGSVAAFFLAFATGWKIGPSIIVLQGVIFLAAYVLSPKYGLISLRPRTKAES